MLDPIPVDLDLQTLAGMLRVKRTAGWGLFQSAVETARRCIAPRAGYTIQYVEARFEDGVVVGGVRFESRVLRKNLEDVERVFPHGVTIGVGLEERARRTEDLLERYYLDAIGNWALIQTRKYLEDALRSRFALKGLSFMSPGSLKDWPIEQQRPLFSLLDGAARAIGVTLTEACLMVPMKSVSGIYFPTETTFVNCQLCPRDRCVGRKAAYSPELADKYGIETDKEAL